jgi:hypothetical protein
MNRGKGKPSQEPAKFHPTAKIKKRASIEPTIQERMTLEFLSKLGKGKQQ